MKLKDLGGVEMKERIRIGIDAGSTTVKVVALDDQGKIIFNQYARHFSNIPLALEKCLGKLILF